MQEKDFLNNCSFTLLHCSPPVQNCAIITTKTTRHCCTNTAFTASTSLQMCVNFFDCFPLFSYLCTLSASHKHFLAVYGDKCWKCSMLSVMHKELAAYIRISLSALYFPWQTITSTMLDTCGMNWHPLDTFLRRAASFLSVALSPLSFLHPPPQKKSSLSSSLFLSFFLHT